MASALRHYMVVTGAYWGFTLTDGAIRMLVVLYFHTLGYTPFEVAMLFLLYEAFGVATNAVGGWLAARLGLNTTMLAGMALQVFALLMLTVPDGWLTVAYVMAAQALSGVAKDLNKMSAKSSVKTIAADRPDSTLFRWVSGLTGSKNALKGAGFFVGAAGLELIGFRGTLGILAGALALVGLAAFVALPRKLGKAKSKPKFTQVFSNRAPINWLSAARFFLFGSRDVWFVVALPVFAYSTLGWSFIEVGTFMALWIIGYGVIQATAPHLLRPGSADWVPHGATALKWAITLSLIPAAMAIAMHYALPAAAVVVVGLLAFGAIFAINSAVHSYLILAYADGDKVAMNVGFYYMANAGGRLIGTVLSGAVYTASGLAGCLWVSAVFIVASAVLCAFLPSRKLTTDHARP